MAVVSRRREHALVAILALAAFTYVVGVLQLSPLLTSLSTEFDVSESAVGQLTTIGGLVGTATALLAAPWMQRFSRRAWITSETGLFVIAMLMMATAQSFAMLAAARVIAGVAGGALIANCFTAASEVIPDVRRRNRAVAIIASGTTLAVLAGLPLVTLIEDTAGWRWASGSLLIPLAVVIVGASWLPDGRVASEPGGGRRSGFRRVIEHRATLWLLGVLAFLFVAYIGWITYFGAYVEQDFAGSAGRLGTLFLVGGLSELAANALAPALFRRFSISLLSLLSAVGLAVTLLGSGTIFSTASSLYVSISLLHVFTSFLYIGSNTLLLDTQPDRRGSVMAIASAATGFGGSAGALIGGIALSALDDYESAYRILGALMLLGAGCLVLSQRARHGTS
jgi:DHA1 family inner membrane transport protein